MEQAGISWSGGGLHGAYLLINHAWRRLAGVSLGRYPGGALTFLAVLVGWVFFRSADLATAHRILSAMASAGQFTGWSWAADGHLATQNIWRVAALLSGAAAIAFLLPNSVEITERLLRAVQPPQAAGIRLAYASMALFGLAFGISVVNFGKASAFLYFQF